jgi:hypothetical protein
MMRQLALTLALAGLAACSRAPRSAAYFEAHTEEAVRVAARCINGVQRGPECDNARAGAAAADRRARMETYRKNF